MDPDVTQDPIFQELLQNLESAARRLRDAVISHRSLHLKKPKKPIDETQHDKWLAAKHAELATNAYEAVRESAAALLRYGDELTPLNNNPDHLQNLEFMRTEQFERVKARSGWKDKVEHPRGYEEKLHVDEGPPITIVIRPEHYEYTDRARTAKMKRKPAINPDDAPPQSV